MLNIIWPIFIIVSFTYAIFAGKLVEINNTIFESTEGAVKFVINLIGTMCLWNGIMQIAMKTSIVNQLTRCLRPIIKKIFPDLISSDDIYKQISMNIIANIMGLGNAATPLGLKAMKTMQKENKNQSELSNSMATFIVLNTASIQIIPTTVIAIRSAMRFQSTNCHDCSCMGSDDASSNFSDCGSKYIS